MTNNVVWPSLALPRRVRLCYTTRIYGVSGGEFASFNLGDHVGDDLAAVQQNRQTLQATVGHPIRWLQQTHSTRAVEYRRETAYSAADADAAYTSETQQICAVLTADCLPVLIWDEAGSQVAAVHAGWRGLAQGILTQTLMRLSPTGRYFAYLGPAISAQCFEVGEDVVQAFTLAEKQRNYAVSLESAFVVKHSPEGEAKFMADLYAIARSELLGAGVAEVLGGERCTYRESDTFFSYRRDGQCGRMASLIWLER